MTQELRASWLAGNQAYLLAEVERVRQVLLRQAAHTEASAPAERPQALSGEPPADANADAAPLAEQLAQMPAPPALVLITQACGLTAFEQDVLLLCVGFELNSSFPATSAQTGGSPTYASFGLALSALPTAHFSALSPEAPLRRDRLVKLAPGQSLATSPLRIEERVLHYLLGLSAMDESLRLLLREVPVPQLLSASHGAVVERAKGLIAVEQKKSSEHATIWLCGPDAAVRRGVAAQLAQECDLTLYALRAADIPHNPAEREELLTRWGREQRLAPVALLLCYQDSESPETLQAAAVWLDRAEGLVLAQSRELLRTGDRPVLRLEVPRPSRDEQVELWNAALGEAAAPLGEVIEQLASQFRLSLSSIAAATAHALGRAPSLPGPELWSACLAQTRPRLDELAQRIDSTATWADLVLPDAQQSSLRALVAQQSQQTTVYHRWGFARAGARGLGVTALFVGQSGTGKTLAAEVIANALALDLYRVDLSQVISKYNVPTV